MKCVGFVNLLKTTFLSWQNIVGEVTMEAFFGSGISFKTTKQSKEQTKKSLRESKICLVNFLLITPETGTFQIKADNCNLVNLFF